MPWSAVIHVPFAPETSASGVAFTGLFKRCWYRKQLTVPPRGAGERVLLHFGAVDYRATVWINGRMATTHEGGYTPFATDITELLDREGQATIVVRADDDPEDLAQPRGKQDWQRQPHSIWYPRTSGIWQTAWIEQVPATWISRVQLTPSLERWEVGCVVGVDGAREDGMRLRLTLRTGETLLAEDTYLVVGEEVHRRVVLSDPGIDDYRNDLLWNPASPRLIDAHLELIRADGTVIDSVRSYTALRSIGVDGDRVV